MRIDALPLPSPKASSINDLPSFRMPVPASMMIGGSPRGRISTHDVLPPYLLVARPGAGIEPRTPQNLTFIGGPLANVLERLARIEKDGHRTVVHQLDPHVGRELPGLDARHAS